VDILRAVPPFRGFLERSLACLSHEAPLAYARTCETLASRAIRADVDGEVVPVRFTRERARVLDEEPARAAVSLRTSRRAILDLLDARCTLVEAVLDDRFFLAGAPDDLVAFHDGFTAYLHGAVRSPSLPDLLAEYRRTDR